MSPLRINEPMSQRPKRSSQRAPTWRSARRPTVVGGAIFCFCGARTLNQVRSGEDGGEGTRAGGFGAYH